MKSGSILSLTLLLPFFPFFEFLGFLRLLQFSLQFFDFASDLCHPPFFSFYVPVCNVFSAFYGYGGYESATVYELFIDGNGKLLCTLNGEAGEDFDEPIGQVQTEGLLEIAHWLEEHGFISADVNDDEIVVCEGCGSDNIQTQAWVDPNARTFIGTTGIDRYDNWCDECEDHQPFCTLKEFKERMEEWWNSLDANQMEQITGCRQDKCPAGDNHQGFAETCNEWWENKGYDEKRKIWKEHNDC